MTMPNGADVVYSYASTHGIHHGWASRTSGVGFDPDGLGGGSSGFIVVTYAYNGVGHVVGTDYPEPDVMSLAYAIGSPNAYGNLDRFNRVVTSQWTKDLGTDHNFFDVDVYYDRASNITWVDDTVLGGWDYEFTIDGLNRLTQAERGTASGGPPPTTLGTLTFDQQWTLDQVGNWDIAKLDRNGDTDFVDTGDHNDDRTHSDANEITARDTDNNGTNNHDLTYFKTGAMKNDGENYKYTFDAFGRLREVRNRGSNTLVAEYTYNGLGFRISEHHDTDTDGDVDGDDATYHFVFDERWRIVATYRDDDDDPKEQFVYHNAGAGGYGGSSYIDAVILRDVDLSTDWDVQADALDTRHYYCQNWRADVSVIIDDSAVLVERIMYSPYGVPFGIPVGDLVDNSTFAEPADGTVTSADNSALLGTYWGSSYNIADLDNDGDVDSADQTILNNNSGATLGWGALSQNHNRLGYAGYVFDEALAGTKWHVRHRVLESVLGRWISRDPLGYIEGANLNTYVVSNPVAEFDPLGTFPDGKTLEKAACIAACAACAACIAYPPVGVVASSACVAICLQCAACASKWISGERGGDGGDGGGGRDGGGDGGDGGTGGSRGGGFPHDCICGCKCCVQLDSGLNYCETHEFTCAEIGGVSQCGNLNGVTCTESLPGPAHGMTSTYSDCGIFTVPE